MRWRTLLKYSEGHPEISGLSLPVSVLVLCFLVVAEIFVVVLLICGHTKKWGRERMMKRGRKSAIKRR